MSQIVDVNSDVTASDARVLRNLGVYPDVPSRQEVGVTCG